ncbi:type III secretion system gatekeeper subunit SctW [Chromobacterium piscinae]|uniref:Type III secretion system gatekeeper subunit SctW n=1 Tax=Chromobacterium piscinae TaxID=686831 RepID=A0ABV0H9R5_9NEIS
MAINAISNHPPARSPAQQLRQGGVKHDNSQAAVRNVAAENTVDAQVQNFAQSVDEMTAALAQFRARRQDEKKMGLRTENLERVLEEDANEKAMQILAIAHTQISAEDLLRQARALFPDDSDLVLVLRELIRRRELEKAAANRLQTLHDDVVAHVPARPLKAGINVGLKARIHGKWLKLSPALLRASYRQFLTQDAHETEIYLGWLSHFGYSRRQGVLDFIESSVLTDIDAHDPSCSQLEFGPLLFKLGQLKLLRATDSLFVAHMLSCEQARHLNSNEADWLVLMLSILQGTQPDVVQLLALLHDTMGARAWQQNASAHAAILQALYIACHNFPGRLFVADDDEDARDAEENKVNDEVTEKTRHAWLSVLREGAGVGGEQRDGGILVMV